jgi:hypothetical protein
MCANLWGRLIAASDELTPRGWGDKRGLCVGGVLGRAEPRSQERDLGHLGALTTLRAVGYKERL